MTTEAMTELEQRDRDALVSEFMRLFYSSHSPDWEIRWLGVRLRTIPLDLWAIQEIIFETRPDLIIECGVAEGGSTLFLAGLLDLIGGQGEIIGVDTRLSAVDPKVREHPRITLLEGSSTSSEIVARLESAAEGRRVMVDLDSDHRAGHVLDELRSLAPLVSPGCYLIVEDTILDTVPLVEDFGPGPLKAIEEWMQEDPPFELDSSREKLLASFHPHGYLRRIGGPTDGAAGGRPPAATAWTPPPILDQDGTGDEPRAHGELSRALEELREARPEIESLRASLTRSSTTILELRQTLERNADRERAGQEELRRLRHGLHEAEAALAGHQELVRRNRELEVRLGRILGTLPFRLYHRFRGSPPLRWIARRREHAYRRDLGH